MTPKPSSTSSYSPSRQRPASGVQTIYLASPISMFWTPQYERSLAAVRRYFKRVRLLEPRKMFSSTDDWRKSWPHILDNVDVLVLLAEADGAIGLGCFCEVLEARARRVLAYLYDGCKFREHFDFALITGGRNLARFARVVPLPESAQHGAS